MKVLVIIVGLLASIGASAKLECSFEMVTGQDIYEISLNKHAKIVEKGTQKSWFWENETIKVEVFHESRQKTTITIIEEKRSKIKASGGQIVSLDFPAIFYRVLCFDDPFSS